jgi:predicted flap endonuclease-1-like 5' DNA nuclease
MVMIEVLKDYLPVILMALLIGVAVGFLVLRPRQRVRLTDSAPTRPHMTAAASPDARRGVATEAATATRNVAGQILDAPSGDDLGDGAAGLDDFQRLKGVGPKFAQILHARGFTRYDQLARLTPEEIERLDGELGPFRGRLQRDRVVEQAAYLARGDDDGFQQRFGKL